MKLPPLFVARQLHGPPKATVIVRLLRFEVVEDLKGRLLVAGSKRPSPRCAE